jgi:hypothetical protein
MAAAFDGTEMAAAAIERMGEAGAGHRALPVHLRGLVAQSDA